MDYYLTTMHRGWRAVLTTILLLSAGVAPAAERVTYYHLDALGSPVAATDAAGNVVWRETYQPYGERIQDSPAAADNARWYTGHVQDADTGLVYAGARYYDPVIGRFLATDPVSFTEKNVHSFNRYAYANNNPYKYIDPDGAEALIIFAEPPVVPRPIIEALPRAAIEAAPIKPQGFRPDFIKPEWGRNRVTKELHDRGYRLDGPTRNDKGLIYRHPERGDSIRIMEKPGRQYRNDPPQKHENDYYWRHQEAPGKEWGPPHTIPNKSQSSPLQGAPISADPCKGSPYCT